jgi:sulfate-transporting ATPase
VYAIAGLGLTQVFRGSGVVNLAHGGFAYAAATMFVAAWRTWGWPGWLAGPAAIGVTALLGAVVHVAVMRPLRHASTLSRLVATLGLFAVMQQGVPLLFKNTSREPIESFYPQGRWRLPFDTSVSYDRLIVLGVSLCLAVVLGLWMSRSRFGLATTAVATNQVVAATMGVRVGWISLMSWVIGSALAGLAGVLILPIAGTLSPLPLLLLVVPALAAALLGGFRSYTLTVAGGIALGISQSLLVRYQTDLLPDHIAVGWPDAVPFIVLITLLSLRNTTIPGRHTDEVGALPSVGRRRPNLPAFVGLLVVGVAASLQLGTKLAASVTTTALFAIIGLSLVVVTGLAGQISLAQVTFAGIGALIAVRASADLGWPFPIALLLGVGGGTVIGALVGLAAMRTRGPTLAVATIGLGLAVEQVVFSNSWFTGGGFSGTAVRSPSLFGLDVDGVDHPNRYAALSVAMLVVCGAVVAVVRANSFGRRLLAVRTNERAAAAAGVSVRKAKLQAFALANAIASVSGVLMAFRHDTVQFSMFGVLNSFVVVVMSVIGGIGYVAGAVVGALLGPYGLAVWFADSTSSYERWVGVASGVIVLAALVAFQSGLVGVWATWRHRPQFTAHHDERRDLDEPHAVSTRAGEGLRVEQLGVVLNGVAIVSGVDLVVAPGRVVGLIGPNGAGKTTLVDAITGFVPHSGRVLVGERDVTRLPAHRRRAAGVARTFQTVEPFADLTLEENLLVALESAELNAGDRVVHPQRIDHEIRRLESELNLHQLGRTPEQLSQGERQLLGVGRALAGDPRVLLLDEPAAGLDSQATAAIGSLVRRLAAELHVAVLLIDHDLDLVSAACDEVVALEFGRVIASGPTAEVLSGTAVRGAYLGEVEAAAPSDEVSTVPPAVVASPRPGVLRERATGGLEVEHLFVSYGDNVVVRDLSLEVRPGEVVALLGRNGAGKTSTLRAIAGATPAQGVVRLEGRQLPMSLSARVSAGMSFLPEQRGVIRTLTAREHLHMIGEPFEKAVAACPELDALRDRTAGLMSGGEQQILAVARCLSCDPRVILVDELSFGLAPTVVRRLLGHLRQAADRGAAVLVVEQYPRAVLSIGDRAYVLNGGDVVVHGSGQDLLGSIEQVESAYLAR